MIQEVKRFLAIPTKVVKHTVVLIIATSETEREYLQIELQQFLLTYVFPPGKVYPWTTQLNTPTSMNHEFDNSAC